MKSAVTYQTITSLHAGQRLDNYLLRELKPMPKSHLYRLIRKGEIRINKKRCKPDYRVQAGDILRLPPLEKTSNNIQSPLKINKHLAEQLKANILFENKQLLIINKLSGIAVHGGSGIRLGIIEAFRIIYPQEKSLELVHRLDRDTSGCLILAKKPLALRQCHELLRNSEIDKRYLLLVKGHWPKALTKVDKALYKNHLPNGERVMQVSHEGKPSVTHFKVVKHYRETTLVEAQPLTGRTHQIRVHAVFAGFPIVGDDKYGDKDFNHFMKTYGVKRLFLHAASLTFKLDEQMIKVKAELDLPLKQCLERL